MATLTQNIWDEKFKTNNFYNYEIQPFAREAVSLFSSHNVKTILDLGCGQGQDSMFFAQQGFKVTSLDFSEQALSCFDHPNIQKIRADMRNIDQLQSNSFDAVYASFSVHFFTISELKNILKNVHQILKPNGFFLFIAKNPKDKYFGKGTQIEQNTFVSEGITRHFFTEEEILSLISEFKLISCTEDSHFMKNDPLSFYYKLLTKKP